MAHRYNWGQQAYDLNITAYDSLQEALEAGFVSDLDNFAIWQSMYTQEFCVTKIDETPHWLFIGTWGSSAKALTAYWHKDADEEGEDKGWFIDPKIVNNTNWQEIVEKYPIFCVTGHYHISSGLYHH